MFLASRIARAFPNVTAWLFGPPAGKRKAKKPTKPAPKFVKVGPPKAGKAKATAKAAKPASAKPAKKRKTAKK